MFTENTILSVNWNICRYYMVKFLHVLLEYYIYFINEKCCIKNDKFLINLSIINLNLY